MTIRQMVERTDEMNVLSSILAEFNAEHEAALARKTPRVCEGCGCTDSAPCADEDTGEACYWVEGYDGDLCSACAAVAVAVRDGEQRVEVYSPAEAQAWIEETRSMRVGAGV